MNSDQLNEARVFSMTAHVIIPLLEERKKNAYERLLGEFRNSKTASLTLVAECNAYSSILDEINTKIQMYEHQTEEK